MPADLILDFIQGLSTAPEITYVEPRASWSGTLTFPGGDQGSDGGYIGPNFGIETGTVPEPGTWIFLATGLLAFGVSRRRSA